MFSHEAWNKLLKTSLEEIEKLSALKGGEYAGDTDRLANFRRNAQNLGLPMETVWAVYAAKHWDAIQQYVQDINTGKDRVRLESITGRVDDLLVYLLLFKAILAEGALKSATAEEMPNVMPPAQANPIFRTNTEPRPGQPRR